MRHRLFFCAVGLVTPFAVDLAVADVPVPTALASLVPGQWTLRARDGNGAARALCLGDPRILLQLEHTGAACTKFVISNQATQAIVHYSCAGRGNGRTTIRVETPRVVQIESQGIVDRSPFDVSYEARRTGECAATDRSARR